MKKLSNSDQLYKEEIIDGDKILCLIGQSQIHVFNRFGLLAPGQWGFAAACWEAITWRPNKTIMVAGFGTYGVYQ